MPSSPPVYLHLGLPKTGTTYLQQVLSENRPALAGQGLLYPGSRADHFLAAQDVLDRPFHGHADERAEGSWREAVAEVSAWPGAALISHELFTVARPEQVATVVDAFAGRRVELIVTARDLARQLTANWQETIKNRQTMGLTEYVEQARAHVVDDGTASGFWYWQDLLGVLRTWQRHVPAERIHLVTVPPRGSDPLLLWRRFVGVLGVELPDTLVTDRSANVSLGAVETEFLRRLNVDLGDSVDWPTYRAQVKQFLAQRALPRFEQSGPIVPAPADQAWAAAASRDLVRALSGVPLQVHGELSDLESPDTPTPATDVSDEAVVEVGVRAIAQLLRKIAREQSEPAIGRTT